MALQPSPPPSASLTTPGLVDLAVQAFVGGKSFVSASAGASDRALTAGTSVADGSVHEQFRLLSLRTGIGGTEKEWFRVVRPSSYGTGVVTIDQQSATNTFGLRIIAAGPGVSGIQLQADWLGQLQLSQQQSGSPAMLYAENKGLLLAQNANSYDTANLMTFSVATPTGVATSIPAFRFESGALGSGQKLARFMANGSEVFAINASSVHFNGYPNGYIYCSGSWLELGALPVRVPSYVDGRDSSLAFYAGAAGRFASNGTLKLMSDTLGAGASDVCVKIGTLTANASVDAAAKIASFVTGFTGTEVEKAFLDKGFGLVVNECLEVGGGSGTAYRDQNVVLTFNSASKQWLFNGYNSGGHVMSLSRLGRFALNGAVAVSGASVSPATAVFRSAGVLNETVLRAEQRSTHTEPIQEWVKNSETTPAIVATVATDGTFENFTNGAGVVLRSPDGTRWRLTITNAGAVNVAAA